MSITLTLSFPTLTAVAEAIAKLSGTPVTAMIEHADQPDMGAPPAAPAAEANPFAAPAAPEAAVVPLPPMPTAPAAPVEAAATAPSAATDPTDVPSSGEGLDSKGLPWDGRIHGSTKSKNADGSWRQKRGLNDEGLKLRIEAELRAAQGASAPVAPPTPPAAPTAPPAAAPTAPPAGETFGQLMARVAPKMQADAGYAVKLNESLAAFGLTSLAGLATRGDLVGPFASYLDAATA